MKCNWKTFVQIQFVDTHSPPPHYHTLSTWLTSAPYFKSNSTKAKRSHITALIRAVWPFYKSGEIRYTIISVCIKIRKEKVSKIHVHFHTNYASIPQYFMSSALQCFSTQSPPPHIQPLIRNDRAANMTSHRTHIVFNIDEIRVMAKGLFHLVLHPIRSVDMKYFIRGPGNAPDWRIYKGSTKHNKTRTRGGKLRETRYSR